MIKLGSKIGQVFLKFSGYELKSTQDGPQPRTEEGKRRGAVSGEILAGLPGPSEDVAAPSSSRCRSLRPSYTSKGDPCEASFCGFSSLIRGFQRSIHERLAAAKRGPRVAHNSPFPHVPEGLALRTRVSFLYAMRATFLVGHMQ
ncbi:hypothetical protein WJX82_008508 [Trebouxia sp. C0006]